MDDDDMLSINDLFKESAKADFQEQHSILQKISMLSTKRSVVSELYSSMRVTAYAKQLGLSPGFAPDLTILDPDDNMPWDFDVPTKRAKALAKIREEKPYLLIGSPMCTAYPRTKVMWRRQEPSTSGNGCREVT